MFNSGIVLNHYFWSDIPANEQYVARKLNSFPEAGPVQLTQRVWTKESVQLWRDAAHLHCTRRNWITTLPYIGVCVSRHLLLV